MCTADQLLSLIFSWIEKRECCADKLRKLAGELESLREKCKAGECVGSSVAVAGAACVIGAGLATLFTAGAAAPFLGILGATYTGVGITVSVAAKITEAFISSDTMKEAKEVEKRSNEIADEIQQLFDKLKAEAKAENPSADPDELDRLVTCKILTSMAKRSGVKGRVSIRSFNGKPEFFLEGTPRLSEINNKLMMVQVAGVLSFFAFKLSGKEFQLLFAEGVKQLVKQMSTAAFKTALKGGAKAVGGAVLLVFALDEAIDNWKDMIKKNHVTEASQSLRDTAHSIRQATQTLREQLDSIKKVMDEMAKYQREQEEKEKKRKAEEEQKEKKRKEEEKEKKRKAEEEQKEKKRKAEEEEKEKKRKGRGNGGGTGGEKQRRKARVEWSSDFSSDTSSQKTVSEDSAPWCNMGLFNARSINNKQLRISNFIQKFDLDILAMTETWLTEENGDQRLGEILTGEFTFYHQPRVDQRGGGVAVGHSNELEGTRVQLDEPFESFEYVAADLRHDEWDRPIRIITVYRPPGGNMENFLEEFENLLEKFPEDDSILITGDFNIKVNDMNNKHAKKFKKLLEDNNLHQHVEQATHNRGNTLDLVITRNVEISHLRVKKPKPKTNEVTERNTTISDHCAIMFSVRPTNMGSPRQP
ncbi:uncharacterized protein LOC127531665 isoform X3 [Acanthochromis polyacanthus]|uniref:uncharacterized protein LOC127531665 isoform X3 n=1 Tax=Acanthochromis polyacanthus TaxID=80966 RepID=UPI00223469A5|nr:uncharacterized protein LOC127531665 isoform X3 [Acanthochromis polyacanthus]